MTVDAKGFPCPVPVMMTKKALDSHTDITVIVDNRTAADNVAAFAKSRGCSVERTDKSSTEFLLRIIADGNAVLSTQSEPVECGAMEFPGVNTVFVFQSDAMGRGNDDLGHILMKAFIHTLTEMETKPSTMVFYNTGVKLASADSQCAADLQLLEKSGVRILVCGTCVNFFELTDTIAAGTISNMFTILETIQAAGKIVTP